METKSNPCFKRRVIAAYNKKTTGWKILFQPTETNPSLAKKKPFAVEPRSLTRLGVRYNKDVIRTKRKLLVVPEALGRMETWRHIDAFVQRV